MLKLNNRLRCSETAHGDVGGLAVFLPQGIQICNYNDSCKPTCSSGSMWSKSRLARERLILRARHKAMRPPTFTSFWRRSSRWIWWLSARNSANATAPSPKKTMLEGASLVAYAGTCKASLMLKNAWGMTPYHFFYFLTLSAENNWQLYW